MNAIETPLKGVILLAPEIHSSECGFFLERFPANHYREYGIDLLFVQDSHSQSARGVLRGLHFQKRLPQAKSAEKVRGPVFDVAVDAGSGSPAFCRWHDPDLNIAWPVDAPLISPRDARLPFLPNLEEEELPPRPLTADQ